MPIKQKKKMSSSLLRWRNVVLLLLLLTFFEELLKSKFNLSVLTLFYKHPNLTTAFLVGVSGLIVADIRKCAKSSSTETVILTPDIYGSVSEPSILERSWNLLLFGIKCFKKSSLSCLLALILGIIFIPAVAAEFHVAGRIVDAIVSIQYPPVDAGSSTSDNSVEMTIIDDQSLRNHTVMLDSGTTVVENNSISSRAFLADPTKAIQLTQNELDILYYHSTPYRVNDWSNIDEIVEILRSQIQELSAQDRPNIFDQQAPPAVQASALQANDMESNLSTSEQLDEIIRIRVSIQSEYPKAAFSNLLSADYQRYALKYKDAGGFFSTIEYYYAQSIFSDLDELTFSSVNDHKTKDILNSIAMRYHDIAHVAEPNSQCQLRASVLSVAFSTLAKEY